MKKIATFFLFLILFIHHSYAIFFRQIGTDERLSQLSVMSIYQDQLGRMWFGTEEGINIFDGVSITAYGMNDFKKRDNFIIGNKVHAIVGDQAGNIYFNADNALYHFSMEEEEVSCLINQGVQALCFHEGKLWFGVNDSIFTLKVSTEEFQFQCKLPTSEQFVTTLLIDSQSRCWIGTNKGLYLLEEENRLTCFLEEYDVSHLFEDSKHNLWISTRMLGLFRYSVNGEYTYFSEANLAPLVDLTLLPISSKLQLDSRLCSNQVRSVVEDKWGYIWMATFQGLTRYNPYQNTFVVYARDEKPGNLTHSSIFPLYKDHQGTIWLGTYYGGVNYFNAENHIFNFYYAEAHNEACLSYPFVGQMVEDKHENIWICTEGGGLNYFDRKKNQFTHFLSSQHIHSIAHNNLKSICYDESKEKLYIGTHTGGLSIYDLRKQRFDNPFLSNSSYKERFGDRILGMELKGDTLIFTTQLGLWKMSTQTEVITPYFDSSVNYGTACFLTDSKGYIWISGNKGLYRIHTKNEADQAFYGYDTHGMGHFVVTHMVEDAQGVVYLGTNGSGFYTYDSAKDSFVGYTTQNSELASDYCYQLKEFENGKYILISGNKGISFFNPLTQTFSVIELGSALPLQRINTGCGLLVSKNGEIFVGGTNGLTTFFEHNLHNSTPPHHLFFSELFINNERVTPNDSTAILRKSISYTEELVLAYSQNDVIVHFRSNNYVPPLQHISYEYRLQGFEERWIPTSDHKISYTNIPPGAYTLAVRERNSTHPHTIELKIKVHPPFYATPLAFLLYLLLILGIIYGILRFKQAQFLLKTSLEMEKKEKIRMAEVNQAKLQFFANISHEFRTPLTLIISQVEVLLKNKALSPVVVGKLKKILFNTNQMRSLISELLDFRKLEQGHTKIKVSEWDLVPFLHEIFISFKEYATTQSLSYDFQVASPTLLCWFDPKQMGKVIYNLLSNAFKYTPKEGSILLSLAEEEDAILIKVIDSGMGIKKEEIDRIFERFYQVDSHSSSATDSFSTGIGLALVKGMVELHHGTVQVESKEGYGTVFIVRLLKGKAHFSPLECIEPSTSLPSTSQSFFFKENQPEEEMTLETPSSNSDVSKEKILLVEDNQELLLILEELFSPTYQVLKASNGVEGIEQAQKELPSLILSDIMMAQMSGLDLCMRVKNDFNICHIPVVLLTALGSTQNSLQGLKVGADDYITKPFDAQILLARCENLITNRYLLQKKFQQEESFEVEQLTPNPIDQKFLGAINEVVEKNLANSEFDVNELARELALSRSSFYAKFKALTGTTPNEYIQIHKLKRAAYWLRNNPEMQIADITYQLGFTSPRYFTRCFKLQFGVTPTEYKKGNQ